MRLFWFLLKSFEVCLYCLGKDEEEVLSCTEPYPSYEAQAQCSHEWQKVTQLGVCLSVLAVGLLDKAVDSGHQGG